MTTVLARLSRWAVLATAGGLLWVAGAGSCLPQNFWSGFLGDTIISGTTSAVIDTIVAQAGT